MAKISETVLVPETTDVPSRRGIDRRDLEVLLKRMEDRRGDFAVIAAGYTHPMEALLASNPGLRSRFDGTVEFPDYSAEDLTKMAVSQLAAEGLSPTPQAHDRIAAIMRAFDEGRDESFGNARGEEGVRRT